ncbi:MAG: homoserine kinase [Pseudomonadota bacterium]
MSVFTPINLAQAERWLSRYELATLLSCTGIATGIQNSNFFLDTVHGAYVLTIFEQLRYEELGFYIALMTHLAEQGIPCPKPIANLDGDYLSELRGKPALLVSRLPGQSIAVASVAHCGAIGSLLGKLHQASSHFDGQKKHPRDAAWCRASAVQVQPFLQPEEQTLLHQELRYQQTHRPTHLPRGVIHADLFRDNVLFVQTELSGVLDFYFAGVDDLLFDVAVTVNDWCCDDDGIQLDKAKCQALLQAYHAERALNSSERAAWPTLLRAAALRFWLSRLTDTHRPRTGDLISQRDPQQYQNILLARIAAGKKQPWLNGNA